MVSFQEFYKLVDAARARLVAAVLAYMGLAPEALDLVLDSSKVNSQARESMGLKRLLGIFMLGKTDLRIFMLGKTETRIFMLGRTEMKILMLGKTELRIFMLVRPR